MKWPYYPYTVDRSRISPSGEVFRPEAKLCVRGDAAYIRALIDTGADHTMFPLSLAKSIGAELFVDEPDAARGVGGHEIGIIPGRVQIELLSEGESCAWRAVVAFADFETVEDECSILGHVGCLEYFHAAFDGMGHVVELTLRTQLPEY